MTKFAFVIFKALMLQTCLVFRSEGLCFNVTLMAEKQFGLSEKQFWRAKAQDVEQCAVLCVRRSTCSSINYDTQSRLCELNNGTKADTPTKTGPHLLYSEFKSWPSSIDPHCFSRPCTHLEVCLPGSLANGNTDDCSHACIRTVFDVCPMPAVGVSNGRTVGIDNVLACGKGFTGGGTATCLETKMWDKEISPCIPIYNHPCDDNELCSKIKATCDNDICECVGNASSFDETLKECVIDCGDPVPLDQSRNATYSGDDKNTRNITCFDGFYPTTGSVPYITCTADGWDQVNFNCYTCDAGPPPVDGSTISGNGRTRRYECKSGLYHIPQTGSINGEITCQENGTWAPTGFTCGGLRLKEGAPPVKVRPHSGYLEMYVDGKWRAVIKTWTWKETMVACKTLFNFTYGGTFHKEWFGTGNSNRTTGAVELKNSQCTGTEDFLEECEPQKDKSDTVRDNEEIALTCFSYNISTPDSVKINGSTEVLVEGLVLVNIFGELGAICQDWDGTNTKVACRTINQAWTRKDESDFKIENNECQSRLCTNYVDCADEHVPHLFYCKNKGWGYNSSCSSLKQIECKLDV